MITVGRIPQDNRRQPERIDGRRPWTRALGQRLPTILLFALVALALIMVAFRVTAWAEVTVDDVRYGRPRTTQLTGWVGHNEGMGNPTQFVAMNLNRQITIFEMPGGDPARTRMLHGPYLFGAGAELTPIGLKLAYINDDQDIDLVITIKDEQILYVNETASSGDFRLATATERAAYVKTLH
jgi:hypothetical protein